MKSLLVATAALSLLAATAAQAEDHHPVASGGQPHGAPAGGGGHPGGGAPHGPTHSGSPRVTANQFSPPPHTGPVPYVPQGQNDRPHADSGGGIAGVISARVAGQPGGGGRHLGHSNFGAPGFTPSSTDRPRYDPQHFPRQINANRHFGWRGGNAWQDQPGFYYRRWGYGQYLPAGWFISQFWINDYADYDLPVPPYGYEWVRSGPDGLLVDTYSGEVVEAVYGLF